MKKYIDKLALLTFKDKKLLNALSYNKDIWFIPGGKREANESDTQALVREIKEELSVTLDPLTLVFYGIFEAQAYGKPEETIVHMTCYTAKLPDVPRPGAEVEKIEYLSYSQKHITSLVSQLIFDYLKAKGYID